MNKATPGPWRWNLRQTNGEVWDGPNQAYMIAQVFGHGCKEVADANGHLLAAAPELLAALKLTAKRYEENDFEETAYRIVLAAIAKAEGR